MHLHIITLCILTLANSMHLSTACSDIFLSLLSTAKLVWMLFFFHICHVSPCEWWNVTFIIWWGCWAQNSTPGPLIYPMTDGASLFFSDLLIHGTHEGKIAIDGQNQLRRSKPKESTKQWNWCHRSKTNDHELYFYRGIRWQQHIRNTLQILPIDKGSQSRRLKLNTTDLTSSGVFGGWHITNDETQESAP